MSPVTHFLTGWVLANAGDLNRRDRAVVTLAAVVPDVDGLGIVTEILTRDSRHPLLWFSQYHHALHTLLFALFVSVCAFCLSNRRWISASLTIALVAAAAYIALHVGAPMLLLGIPVVFGANLLLWRTGYQRERPVSQRAAILTRRVELQERIQVMQQRISDIEAEKQRANQQVSVRKAASVKTQKDLLQEEQKAHGLNDVRLQSSI